MPGRTCLPPAVIARSFWRQKGTRPQQPIPSRNFLCFTMNARQLPLFSLFLPFVFLCMAKSVNPKMTPAADGAVGDHVKFVNSLDLARHQAWLAIRIRFFGRSGMGSVASPVARLPIAATSKNLPNNDAARQIPACASRRHCFSSSMSDSVGTPPDAFSQLAHLCFG